MPTTALIKTLNVNLFAGPGVGKSVTAAALFVALKMRGVHAELIGEYAKELVYDGDLNFDQKKIITEQHRRQARLQGKVAVAITDSALPVALAYADPSSREMLGAQIRALTRGWRNLNVLLHRDLMQSYEQEGRYQSRDEAIRFHHQEMAPFVRAFHGEDLVECGVDTAVPALVARVLVLLES